MPHVWRDYVWRHPAHQSAAAYAVAEHFTQAVALDADYAVARSNPAAAYTY